MRGRRARPVFSYEHRSRRPPQGRGSGPRSLEPGGADAPLSVRKRARAQALRTAAILEAAGLRYDGLMEAQLGDAIFFGDLVDLSIFGSKTDPLLVGQAAVMPASAAPISGAAALREHLPCSPPAPGPALPGPHRPATRFRASLTSREMCSGAEEFAGWPAEVRQAAERTPVSGRPACPLPACLRPMAACSAGGPFGPAGSGTPRHVPRGQLARSGCGGRRHGRPGRA